MKIPRIRKKWKDEGKKRKGKGKRKKEKGNAWQSEKPQKKTRKKFPGKAGSEFKKKNSYFKVNHLKSLIFDSSRRRRRIAKERREN